MGEALHVTLRRNEDLSWMSSSHGSERLVRSFGEPYCTLEDEDLMACEHTGAALALSGSSHPLAITRRICAQSWLRKAGCRLQMDEVHCLEV